jgi:ketosteroid isomerase-like protein
MKQAFIIIVLVIAAFTLAPAQTKGREDKRQSRDREMIVQTVHDWLDALVRKDMNALNRIIADDYLITLSDGRIINKTEDLVPVAAPDLKFETANVEDLNVRIFGQTAVVTGRGIYQVNFKGRSSTIYERFTDVYVKRGGRWQPVASHSTTLTKPNATPQQP